MTPLVSVITVSCNAKYSIEDTIISVLNQSYKNIEYIIIDGASNDGTVDIIKKYDSIIWISEPDNGIYDAMNKGLELCKGQWILFLGADDLLNDSIVRIVPFLKNENDIIYGNVIYMQSKKIYGGKFDSLKFITKNIPHQAIFYPCSIFQKYKFDTNYPILSDYHFNLRCWNDKNISFVYIDEVVSIYNEDGISSKKFDYEFFNNQLTIFMKYFPIYLYPYIIARKSISYIYIKLKKILMFLLIFINLEI